MQCQPLFVRQDSPDLGKCQGSECEHDVIVMRQAEDSSSGQGWPVRESISGMASLSRSRQISALICHVSKMYGPHLCRDPTGQTQDRTSHETFRGHQTIAQKKKQVRESGSHQKIHEFLPAQQGHMVLPGEATCLEGTRRHSLGMKTVWPIFASVCVPVKDVGGHYL